MMMRPRILALLIGLSFSAQAQIGGDNTYEFLNLPVSAREAALGGQVIAVSDDDINLTYNNPALIDTSKDNHLALNYVNYFSDINYGYAAYSKSFEKIGSFRGGMRYIDYGWFTGADETGTQTGNFKVAEYAFNLGYGRRIDSVFSIGANLKTIYSGFEQYTSWGSALDLAGVYYSPSRGLGLTALIKNIGMQWTTYAAGNREPLPFEVQLGLSKKLKNAPFRFSILAQHLQQWDLTYDDPNNPKQTVDPLTGEAFEYTRMQQFWNDTKVFLDKGMRHVVLGGEILITQNFHLRMGFDYKRRKELQVSSRRGMGGFSFGFGFKVSKFRISYGHAKYHLAGGSNHFSVTTNLSDFYTRK